MEMETKKKLGQFYTTNYEYILREIVIPDGVENIIEPFVGKGDLLKFINKSKIKSIESFDLEPIPEAIKRDTLKNPPEYKGKYVITNPPYLARNKNIDKTIYDKYKQNDLYKCFIQTIINDPVMGGIILIPLNFLCSIRVSDIELRKSFIELYNIEKIKIFQERVFDDTSYTICVIQFTKKLDKKDESKNIECIILPQNIKCKFNLNKKNNYTIGGELYFIPISTKYKITRLLDKKTDSTTNIVVRCIDNDQENKIACFIVDDDKLYYDKTEKKSCRTFATLNIEPKITKEQQKKVCEKFNDFLNSYRDKYNSLFLVNYRESKKGFSRKRISFDLVYRITSYCLE
jgi:hypothetical protein